MSQHRWMANPALPVAAGRGNSPAALLGAVGLAVLAGIAVSIRPLPVVAIAAVAAFAVLSWSRPRLAVAVGLLLMALPYTWSPTLFSVILAPALVVSAVWLGVALVQGRPRFRPRGIDFAVCAFVLAPALSALVTGYSLGLFWFTIVNVALPYSAARLYLSTEGRGVIEFLPPALIGVGCAVATLAFVEVILGHNPTTHVLLNPQLTQWTEESTRSGFVRAQASFGHPIALGAFLLLPAGFAAAWPAPKMRWALILLIPAVLVTFSRGPWIGLAVILLLTLLTEGSIRGRIPSILALVLLIGGIAWFFGPVHHVIDQTFSTGTVEAGNATYRSKLVEAAFENLSFAGKPVRQSQVAELLPGFRDLTSTLAITILRTGVIGLASLVALLFFAIRALVQAVIERDAYLRAIGIVIIAQLVVLIDIALVTNYQYMFWLSLAFLGVYQADRAREREPRRQGLEAAPGVA